MGVWSKKIQQVYKVELIILTVVLLCAVLYSLFIRGVANDEREHIYASFMIYKGFMPYVDFFEHHHPLLWFLFYPLMCFFNNSAHVWYVARIFALLMLSGQCFFVFKISRLISSNALFSLLSLLFFIAPERVLYSGCEFRPDNLMMLFFLVGLYCWLCFVKNGWQSALNLSFMMFFLAVMALQKALISIFPIVCVSLFLLYCGKMSWQTLFKAMLLPVFFFMLFIIFWYSVGGLRDYVELNWFLNFKQKFSFKNTIDETIYCQCAIGGAMFVLVYSKDILLKIISFLAITTFLILHFFVYTPWGQYWLPIYPYFALLIAYCFSILKSLVWRFMLLTGILIAVVVHLVNFIIYIQPITRLRSFVFLSQQVLSLSSPGDFIVGNNVTLGGLRFEATGYYWYERGYTARLDYLNFQRRAWLDTEKIIKETKPKIIANDTVLECISENMVFSWETCRHVRLISDDEFLDKNYDNYGYIYVRKD